MQRTPHIYISLDVLIKQHPPMPESDYLFSCLITCLHGYKIGHKKRINKVLLTVSRYTTFIVVLSRRALFLETEKANINHLNFY